MIHIVKRGSLQMADMAETLVSRSVARRVETRGRFILGLKQDDPPVHHDESILQVIDPTSTQSSAWIRNDEVPVIYSRVSTG
jgi:hypothetical protein